MSAVAGLAESLTGVPAPALALAVARAAPTTMLLPFSFLGAAPGGVRVAVAASLAWPLTLVSLSASGASLAPVGLTPATLAVELTLGTLFAVALAAPFAGLAWAGELVDGFRGASQARLTAPGGASHSPLGLMAVFFALAWGAASGLLRLTLEALAQVFARHPLGAPFPLGAGVVEGALLAILSALEISVVIAGPAIGMMILVELLIGWLGRMSQGLQTHFVAMPARAAAGLFGLALALSFVPPRLHGWIRAALDASTRLP